VGLLLLAIVCSMLCHYAVMISPSHFCCKLVGDVAVFFSLVVVFSSLYCLFVCGCLIWRNKDIYIIRMYRL